MTERHNGDKRAADEGMGEAIGAQSMLEPAEDSLLQTPEVLDQVLEEFWHTETATTVGEAARSLAENMKMPALREALAHDKEKKLRDYLRQHVGEERWAEIEKEELSRQLYIDKTFVAGTPG